MPSLDYEQRGYDKRFLLLQWYLGDKPCGTSTSEGHLGQAKQFSQAVNLDDNNSR